MSVEKIDSGKVVQSFTVPQVKLVFLEVTLIQYPMKNNDLEAFHWHFTYVCVIKVINGINNPTKLDYFIISIKVGREKMKVSSISPILEFGHGLSAQRYASLTTCKKKISQ